MDKKAIILDKQESLKKSLNTKNLNLEIAQNIENTLELSKIIKSKANANFLEKVNKGYLSSILKKPNNIDGVYKLNFYIIMGLWYLLYRNGYAGLTTLFVVYMSYRIYKLHEKESYSKLTPEYKDYIKSNESLNEVIKMKINMYNTNDIYNIIIGSNKDNINMDYLLNANYVLH